MLNPNSYSSFLKDTRNLFEYLKELKTYTFNNAKTINLEKEFKKRNIDTSYVSILTKIGMFENEHHPKLKWNINFKINNFLIKEVFNFKSFLLKTANTPKLNEAKLRIAITNLEKIVYLYKVDIEFLKDIFSNLNLTANQISTIVYYLAKHNFIKAADKKNFKLNYNYIKSETGKTELVTNIIKNINCFEDLIEDDIDRKIKAEVGIIKFNKLTFFEKRLLKDFKTIYKHLNENIIDRQSANIFIKKTFATYKYKSNLFDFLHTYFLEPSSVYISKNNKRTIIETYKWNSRKYSKIYKERDLPDSKMIQQIVRKNLKYITPIQDELAK